MIQTLTLPIAALSLGLLACAGVVPVSPPAATAARSEPEAAPDDLAQRLERALAAGAPGDAALEAKGREEVLKAGSGAAVFVSDIIHQGISFGPEDFEGIVKAAVAYHRTKGDLQRAESAYSLAILLQPAIPLLYAERSSVRWRLGRLEEAHADHRVAQELQDIDADAFDQRDAAIQAVMARMPIATLADPDDDAFEKLDWTGPVIRIEDGHVYGLRFVTPRSRARLDWCFVPPEGLVSWYILPATGIMRGFDSFKKLEGEVSLDGGRQRKTLFVQSLDRAYLEPETEYAIWFAFKDDAPRRLWHRIGLITE